MARHARPAVKMLQNSLFLMASAGLTAGIGFIFWAVVARLYSPERIGFATSLLSAVSLISFLSLFGLNSTLIRFPAAGRARDSQVTIALAAVSVTSSVIGTAYLAGLDLFGPQLEFIRESPPAAVAFVLICVFAAVNLLTDSVFIAARIPEYNALVDGVIQSLAKLAMPIFLVALGAAGIVISTGVGYAVAVLASLIFMRRKLKFRLDFKTRGTRLRASAKYSATSYASALLNLIPLLVMPSLVLRTLGAADAAYYFLAYQVASLLAAASHAIGDTLFAEGSHDQDRMRELLLRSAKIMAVVVVPAALLVTMLRGPLLGIFGAEYSHNGSGILAVLCLGSIAAAFNTWASSVLRILGRMPQLLVSNLIFTLAVVGLTAAFASRGLLWVGYAWTAGNLLSGLAAAVCIPGHLSGVPVPETAEDQTADDVGREQEFGWSGVGDAITEPLFFPWNRRTDATHVPHASYGKRLYGEADLAVLKSGFRIDRGLGRGTREKAEASRVRIPAQEFAMPVREAGAPAREVAAPAREAGAAVLTRETADPAWHEKGALPDQKIPDRPDDTPPPDSETRRP